MKVARSGGLIYVLPDEGKTPLAGPFATTTAGRLWIVEQVEAKLAPAKRETWRRVAERLPPPSDMGLELGLIGFVARGMTWEQIQKYIPRRPVVDSKTLASGERAA